MKDNTNLRLSAIAMVIAYFAASILNAKEYITSLGVATNLRYDENGDSPLEKLLFNMGSLSNEYLSKVARFNWLHFSDNVKMDPRVPNVVKLPFLKEHKDYFISSIEMETDIAQKVMERHVDLWEKLVASIILSPEARKGRSATESLEMFESGKSKK